MTVELAPSPPHILGPVWQKTVDGQWHLPENTLGWGVINWWAEYVKTPAGENPPEIAQMLAQSGLTPYAFVPTQEQVRFVLWWYAVDENGVYAYREGMLRRLKGWGKDPLVAALGLVELCGPVAFSHFDANGDPVGKARHAAWVQIVAVSQDQTKNTFRLFPVMISQKLKSTYGLEINKFIIYSAVGGTIEAVTSAPASMEGNRPTFVIQNEIQWWGTGPGGEVNDGHDLEGVAEGNLTKTPGARRLSICNAHRPGNDTVAEKYHDSWMDVQAGEAFDVGFLYDALEAPADTPLSEIPFEKDDPEGFVAGVQRLREGLKIACGDSYWLPVEEILKSVLDPKNDISESRRKFLNQVNASEDAWITPQEWDRLSLHDKLFELKPGDRVALGFDGSKSNDWTALVACRISDGCMFLIKAWNPENYEGHEIPRDEVDAVVRSTVDRYEVVAFRADVKEFEAYVDQWGSDFRRDLKVNATPGNPVAYDMRGQKKQFALDCERFLDAVQEREAYHNGDKLMRTHILNARRHPTTYDAIAIRKQSKDSSKKIDVAVCCVLSFGARQDFLMSKKNRGTGAVIFR